MGKLKKIAYRLRQFWLAVAGRPTQEQLKKAAQGLTPMQLSLFLQLQLSEQAHAFNVLERIEFQGAIDPDLVVAALLHDVGKARHPLRLWERVWIVIGQALFPRLVQHWGTGRLRGLERACVIAAQHPAWGAEMAEAVEANEMVVQIIALHQNKPIDETLDLVLQKYLRILQQADDAS